jgi:integrase/recombinase XerD
MAKNFHIPNRSRKLPNVFNKKQIVSLFEAIDDTDVFMASFMALFCGLRISEVCNLKKKDVDLESEKVFVRQGKGAKDRIVMLPSKVKPVIERWFRLNTDSDYYVSGFRDEKYNANILSQHFKKYLDKAGLLIKSYVTNHGQQRQAYSFHTLRHTYATMLLEKGVDLYYVQRSLGHGDIHTTQIYAYISHADLRNKINMAFGKRDVKKEKRNLNVSDPLQLLKLKYADGEIDQDEFEQKYQLLAKLGI